MTEERVVSINGDLKPESSAFISYRDVGFIRGDSAFDTMRTFRHELFRLNEHLDRLERSLRYIGVPPALDRREMTSAVRAVVARNARLISDDDDYWVTIRISGGEEPPTRGVAAGQRSTTVISCDPLPFGRFSMMYSHGVRLLTAAVRRTPPECLDPRAKISNYLNQKLADLEAKSSDPQARPLMLDVEGNVAESSGANIFLVQQGRLLTPPVEHVLPGISRSVTIELARANGIPVEEKRLTLFDAYTSDEAFLTATSFCLMPVASVDARPLRQVGGEIVQRLTQYWRELVGMDFVSQAVRIADSSEAKAVAS